MMRIVPMAMKLVISGKFRHGGVIRRSAPPYILSFSNCRHDDSAMKHPTLYLCLAGLLAGCAAASLGGSASDADLAITNVSVIDVENGKTVPDQTVLIKGDRIVAVEASRGGPASGIRRMDGNGKYLIPGLWDMHAHLHLSSNPTGVEMPLLIAHGVTGVRIMGSDRPFVDSTLTPGLNLHRNWQTRIAAGTLTGPRLLALASWAVNGTSGITDSMPRFYRATTRLEGQELARYFKARGFDFIKIYNNVSGAGYLGLTEEARRLGLPFAGHEPASLSAIELSNAGQKSIEHSRVFLFNCWPGADSMRKGLLQSSQTVRRRRMVDEYDPKICAQVFHTFAKNGTWITPTHGTRKMDAFADNPDYRRDPRLKFIPLSQQVAWLQDADRMVATDSSAAGRRSYLDFYRKGLELTNAAYRAGVPLMLGTDAGDSFIVPGASVHDELGELVQAGLSPAEALRAATLSGAEYLGRTSDFGTVASGRVADLVLLDANPLEAIGNSRRIHAVVFNGRVLDRSALDSLLAGVEAAVRPTPQQRLWAGATLGDTVAIAQALEAGARIDSLDTGISSAGRRALNYAALSNRGPAVRLLIARGASLNLANNTGFTPVHHAVEGNALEALSILIAAGANASLTNMGGARPIDMARRRNNPEMIRLLESAAPR